MVLRRTMIRQSRLKLSPAPLRSFSHSNTSYNTNLTADTHPQSEPLNAPNGIYRVGSEGRASSSTVQEEYENFRHFKSTTGQLGSSIAAHYAPYKLVNKPPRPRDVTLETLMAAGAHLGHATSLWNPGNQRYIFGVRQGIHIISLEVTAAYLRRAAKVVEGVTRNGGLVLFVGNRQGMGRSVVEAAKNAGGCHLPSKWLPGTITNGKKIVGNAKVVEKDMADRTNPEAPDNPAPVRPDLVVCLNPLENYIVLHECGQYGIPTIGIIDTDADPTWVTYPIPANDDSLRCTNLIAGVLGRAGQAGREARIQAVKMKERQRGRSNEQDVLEV